MKSSSWAAVLVVAALPAVGQAQTEAKRLLARDQPSVSCDSIFVTDEGGLTRSVCDEISEGPRVEGVTYYSDGSAHVVVKVLSDNVRQSKDDFGYKLVLTRTLNPGDSRGGGLIPRPNPPSPVCPDPNELIGNVGQITAE